MVRIARLLVLVALVATGCSRLSTSNDVEPTTSPSTDESDAGIETNPPTTEAGGDTSETDETSSAATVDPVAWDVCQDGVIECGTVAVPLDHDDAGGPSIDLALVRYPATGDDVLGTIFVNPGGPGGSGVEYVTGGFRFDDEISARYHLVGFDPRGVGQSEPIACRDEREVGPLVDHSPDSPEEIIALDQAAATLAAECAEGENGGADGPGPALLAEVDTDAVARDLDLLRQAVGDEQLHYYGFSYGTLIGLVYADLFPENVAHLGLDGVVDPQLTVPQLLDQQAGAFESAFLVLDAACGAELACPAGGVAVAHDELVRELEANGPIGEFGQTEAEMAALVVLYSDAFWPVYAAALTAAAEQGQTGELEQLSDLFVSSISFTSYAAVVCTDSPRPESPEDWESFAAQMAADHPRFGAVVANELRVCAHWPEAAGEPRSVITATGAAPALVVGNTNDPATPLANAELVAEQLDQAALVVFDSNGHTAYRSSACVRQLVTDYFISDTVPTETVNC